VPFVCSLGDYSNHSITRSGHDTHESTTSKSTTSKSTTSKSTTSKYTTSKSTTHEFPGGNEIAIVELAWNPKKNVWDFHCRRADREVEIATGRYYGNNYKIAEETLQSSLNPLT